MELTNTAISKRTFAKDKRKQMDRLSRESCEALALGMSYGQYKAHQKDNNLGEPAAPRKPFLINPGKSWS